MVQWNVLQVCVDKERRNGVMKGVVKDAVKDY